MLTIILILVLCALLSCILSMAGYCPIGVPVLLLCIIELLRVLPIGGK